LLSRGAITAFSTLVSPHSGQGFFSPAFLLHLEPVAVTKPTFKLVAARNAA
jgi:hypothetical protein